LGDSRTIIAVKLPGFGRQIVWFRETDCMVSESRLHGFRVPIAWFRETDCMVSGDKIGSKYLELLVKSLLDY